MSQFITAEEIKKIKSRIKTEMNKRTKDSSNSLALYGSSTYDFSIEPEKDKVKILKEHYEKIVEPLIAANANAMPSLESDKLILEEDYYAISTLITSLESFSNSAGITTNKAGCEGACIGYCQSECSNTCISSCSRGCSYSCSSSCDRSNCRNGCEGGCNDNCATGCSAGTCGGGCWHPGCTTGCSTDCRVFGECDTCWNDTGPATTATVDNTD